MTEKLYPFALADGSSDGKQWNDAQFNSLHSKLDENDKRYADWKFKLGGMLREQLLPGPEYRDRTYYLRSLPEHYHIRVKTNPKNGRSDYYLYGYPEGKKPKPFRSPNDFFPHLLWLAGGSGDKSLCSCVLCNPDQARPDWWPEQTAFAHSVSDAPPDAPSAVTIASPVPSSLGNNTGMKRSASAPGSAASKPFTGSKQTPQSPAPPPITPVSGPTSSGQPQSSETPLQRVPHTQLIFREGEVVWFKNNNAWRIGMALQTLPAEPGNSSASRCIIKPLAHAYFHNENAIKNETDMRPFLAFSVPPVNPNVTRGQLMKDIPWGQLQTQLAGEDKAKQELVGLEASKLAAIEIDHSYSTFNPMQTSQQSPDIQHVGGVFLGAERITMGEAVRVRLSQNEIDPTWTKGLPIVMVVRDIFIAAGSGLFFRGDVYRLEETANQQQAPHQAQLPAELIREKSFRDQVKQRLGTRFDWIMVQQDVTKPENSMRGRFYETSRLMPIIDAAKFQAALSKAVVEDVQAYLNDRMNSDGPYLGRRRNRSATLVGAVPDGFYLPLGPGVLEDP
ncbi:uncharacterized protein BCR38DRAFT_217095 [Pseudomassariella vexata]|uniref:Transcription-silencing protein Clr2-domain-containing protein n=1 Tax=Pseudomassariella vexata TaxID=1141098 RepID=A0A1Y2DUG9_9PEZI|nr:uncharacterized protein BCR38DRAFT_217095 [Pseudomassariella vexata]ORY62898.1 hypothetical protein BCR38DRAFT_217095 [Pseudomassariella vexata]